MSSRGRGEDTFGLLFHVNRDLALEHIMSRAKVATASLKRPSDGDVLLTEGRAAARGNQARNLDLQAGLRVQSLEGGGMQVVQRENRRGTETGA